MSDESTDESGFETSVSDLQFSLDDKVNVELFQKLIQLLPANSELNPEMYSPDELRGCAGKQDVISDHMYSQPLAYLIWKQSRKANERIPEGIQLWLEISGQNPGNIEKFIKTSFRKDSPNINLR